MKFWIGFYFSTDKFIHFPNEKFKAISNCFELSARPNVASNMKFTQYPKDIDLTSIGDAKFCTLRVLTNVAMQHEVHSISFGY